MIINISHMEYITFYTINRTAFDILAYFGLSSVESIYTWTLLVSTPEHYSYLHRLPLNRVESQCIQGLVLESCVACCLFLHMGTPATGATELQVVLWMHPLLKFIWQKLSLQWRRQVLRLRGPLYFRNYNCTPPPPLRAFPEATIKVYAWFFLGCRIAPPPPPWEFFFLEPL